MKKLLLFFLAFLFSFGQEELNLPFSPSKFVYIKNITPKEILDQNVYIGQQITITYSLLLLSDANLVDVSFDSPINPSHLKLLNADQISWIIQADGSYQASYVYKILSKQATIPQIKATAISQDQNYQDIAISPNISLDIYNLQSNPKYSGVIGDAFDILRTKTKKYDENHNILILEIEGKNTNIEDFKIPLPDIIKQGFQTLEHQIGIYYCIFPKTYSQLSFDFFSLPNNQFESITIPIVVSQDNTAGQDDLKPKNIFLLYSTLFLIAALLVSIMLYIFFWRNKITLCLIIGLLIFLLWHIFYRNDFIFHMGQEVKILPTNNSTTLFVITQPMRVEIIGTHENFYKIITPDGRIGWINKEKN